MEKAKAVIDTLNRRKGFGEWWYNISLENQMEIIKEIEVVINGN